VRATAERPEFAIALTEQRAGDPRLTRRAGAGARAAPRCAAPPSINACDRDPIRRIYRSPGSTGRSAGEAVKRPPRMASPPTATPDPEEESHAMQ
jgi:hypothetical protein